MSLLTCKSMKAVLFYLTGVTLGLYACKKKDAPEPLNSNPTACFQTSKSNYRKMESVHFNNCSSNFERVEWYFGDGGESKYSEPDYRYALPGIYTVRLKTFNGVNSTEASKKIWIADTIRVGYILNWDSTIAKQGDLIVVRYYYRKKGELTYHPTFSGSQSHTSGNKIFWGGNSHIVQSGFVDIPNPGESMHLKIVAACYTGPGMLPDQLVVKDSLLTQEIDGFNGPGEPGVRSKLTLGKLNQQYSMAHR